MATFVNQASGQATSSVTDWDFSIGNDSNIAGTLAILAISVDNLGTNGASPVSGVTDNRGNDWRLIGPGIVNNTAGVVDDGCTLALYGLLPVENSLISSQGAIITIHFSTAVTARAAVLVTLSDANPEWVDSNSATGSGTTYSVGPSVSLNIGDVIVGAVARNSGTIPNPDADSTNGPWGSQGAGFTSATIVAQWKVTINNAGTQTMDATMGGAAAAWAAGYLVFRDTGVAFPPITVTQMGSAGNKSAEASTSITASKTAFPGDVVLVCIGADNAGTAGASSISSVTDSQGNAYAALGPGVVNRTSGSAVDGCTAAIFGAVVAPGKTIAGGVDSITVNWSPNTTAKAFQAFRVHGTEPVVFSSGSASGSGASYTSGGASVSLDNGDLIIGVVVNESNTVPVTDTDTTNGSWVAAGDISGGTGGDATKMATKTHYKIVTAAGSQTLDGSTGASTDWAALYLLFHKRIVGRFVQSLVPVQRSANW